MPEITEVTLHVKPEYKGAIQAITVNGFAATHESDTAEGVETWFRRLEGWLTVSQLTIQVTSTGSQDEIPIAPLAGSWPEPVDRVTKMNYRRPAAGMDMTMVKVYLKANYAGVLNSVSVNGKIADLPISAGVLGVRFEADVNTFNVTAFAVDYTPPATDPGGGGETDLIISAAINYSDVEGGYVAIIYIQQAVALDVSAIRITDVQGAVLAEYPGGGLGRRVSPFNLYQGLVEESAAGALDGKTVNIYVETANGNHDDVSGTYATSN
jgi:hypothetical protein